MLPASIALRLGKNFKSVILLANFIGFVGMIAGLYISYYAETPAKRAGAARPIAKRYHDRGSPQCR